MGDDTTTRIPREGFRGLLGALHLQDLGDGGPSFCKADLLRMHMRMQDPDESGYADRFIGVDLADGSDRSVIAQYDPASGMYKVIADHVIETLNRPSATQRAIEAGVICVKRSP